jgi:hypothetical protein
MPTEIHTSQYKHYRRGRAKISSEMLPRFYFAYDKSVKWLFRSQAGKGYSGKMF